MAIGDGGSARSAEGERGSGTSSAAIARAGHRVLASDFSAGMMAEGRKRQPHIPFVGADATNLPFTSDSFDAAVISFGLRNVVEPRKALSEMARVVKPGGAVVVCEFSTPNNRAFRHVYSRYIMGMLPHVASQVSANGAAYSYLAESILAWPDQEGLREWFLELGLPRLFSCRSGKRRQLFWVVLWCGPRVGVCGLRRGGVGRSVFPRCPGGMWRVLAGCCWWVRVVFLGCWAGLSLLFVLRITRRGFDGVGLVR